MVTIQPVLFISSITFDLNSVNGSLLRCYKSRALDVFTFEFAILSGFTRKDNCLFCLHLYLFHLLRQKKKMDSLLFLIKKHNNKTVRYIDKLAYKIFITNKIIR